MIYLTDLRTKITITAQPASLHALRSASLCFARAESRCAVPRRSAAAARSRYSRLIDEREDALSFSDVLSAAAARVASRRAACRPRLPLRVSAEAEAEAEAAAGCPVAFRASRSAPH